MKITIHIDVEITEDGRVMLAKGSYTPRDSLDRSHVNTQEVAAFAAAFVSSNTGVCPPQDHGNDAVPLFDQPTPILPDTTPRAEVRGRVPTGTAGPRPPSAIADLVSVGVTAIIAKQICAKVGTARATSIGKWMRDRPDIGNADAVAIKLASRS